MATILHKKLQGFLLSFMAILLFSFPSMAASVRGELNITDSGVNGWAWDSDNPSDALAVELEFYDQNSTAPCQVLTVKANYYNKNLDSFIGDGTHWFQKDIDWMQAGKKPQQVKAYALIGSSRIEFDARTTADSPESLGPGAPKKVEKISKVLEDDSSRHSLGMFITTGYCTCDTCSSGHGLTYSGTVPQAKHTISADLSVFPLGTKIMIDEIVYTVEDIGSSVANRKLDIYYASHADALAHGVKTQEVFALE